MHYSSHHSSVIVAVAALGLSSAALAGPDHRTKCTPSCVNETLTSFTVNNSSLVTFVNCDVIEEIVGHAQGFVQQTEMYHTVSYPQCDPTEDPAIDLYMTIVGPVDADQPIVDRYALIGGMVGDSWFSAEANFTKTGCYTITETNVATDILYQEGYVFDQQVESFYSSIAGGAGASIAYSMVTSAPLQIDIDIDLDAELIFTYDNTCAGLTQPGTTVPVRSALMRTCVYYVLEGDVQSPVYGMIVYDEVDGLTQFGAFADPALVVTSAASSLAIAGTVSVSTSVPKSASASIADLWDTFTYAYADVDGNGFFTRCDHTLINTLVGSQVGDGVYDPRGDLDLDGDIDSSDVTLLEDEFQYVGVDLNGCIADYNGDGAVNFFDSTEFQQGHMNLDPSADLNCDGDFNFFDISKFLTHYNSGC